MPKNTDPNQSKLFIGKDGQLNLLNKTAEQMVREEQDRKVAPVECLGQTFPGDAARREHYLKLLAEKLKDPEFRKTPGFPIGTDEDILRMSDPPYYTACPNPFIEQFARSRARIAPGEGPRDSVLPFAEDMSHGKGDLVYSAHSYHTKVPPQAIAQYILHYTQPGDVVLDPFCGSGMTGLAALLCGNRKLLPDVTTDAFTRWGARVPLLIDLSPAATFIASVYASPPDADVFASAASNVLERVVGELTADWTLEGNDVEYFVRAEVFSCPNCQQPVVSDSVVAMTDTIGAATAFPCPHCRTPVSKAPTDHSQSSLLERHLYQEFDPVLNAIVPTQRMRTVLAMTRGRQGSTMRRLSSEQSELVDRNRLTTDHWFPSGRLIQGDRLLIKDCCQSYGISHVHHFYSDRQRRMMAAMYQQARAAVGYPTMAGLLFWVQSYGLGATRLNRFIPARDGKAAPGSQVNRYFTGTLYIPSMVSEVSPRYLYERKIERLRKAFSMIGTDATRDRLISTQSATCLSTVPDKCVDYIFTDPPFGQNLQYSELNQLWEAWLRIMTERESEAVIDDTRHRNVGVYQHMMFQSFKEMYRVLKPGRWLTLEFHNSFNSVWTAIQEGLLMAGFVVADVRVLDKQQDTYKQSRQGLVKKDLVISAYRPTEHVEQAFKLKAGTIEGVWEFVFNHLRQVPIFAEKANTAEILVERQTHLLFDRMLGYHIQHGVSVPLSASEFELGLTQRLAERDGMWFLPEHVSIYDAKRLSVSDLQQLELIPSDEESAIQWLRQELKERPSSLQDLTPRFLKAISGWAKHEARVELADLLRDNFLCQREQDDVPAQIHAYLSTNHKDSRKLAKDDPSLRAKAAGRWYVPDPKKATDLEKLREKSLLKEFETYKAPGGKRLKVFRLEAVRAGFKKAWEAKDYKTIIEVAKRIPEDVLQEDQKLVMWYDNALTRMGTES